MPLYEYWCQQCGYEFEEIKPWEERDIVSCPKCGAKATCKISAPSRITILQNEQLPFGNKSRGKLISPEETGGLGILVPSFGALEKEEVDYVAMEAVEKEKDRVRKGKQFVSKQRATIQKYMNVAHKAPSGKRIEAIEEVARQEGTRLIKG